MNTKSPILRFGATFLFALLFAFTKPLLADQPPSGTDKPAPTVQSAIDAQEAAFLKAVLAGDKMALDQILADDFVYDHENALISTKAQFFSDYLPKGYVSAKRTSMEPDRQYGSTVLTISRGDLQLSTETPWPVTTVSHIWAEQQGKWRLVQRVEAHKGEPIGKQLSPLGGPNLTGELGSKPAPEVAKIINEHEAAWAYGMITTDVARMDKLHDASLRYIHINGVVKGKIDFMDELMGGFPETYSMDATMRQFGDTVLVLHRAQYRHLGKPEQSPSLVLDAWYKRGNDWVMVGRCGAHFVNY